LSRDPIEEKGGPSIYGFVRNRATGRIDTLGRCEPDPSCGDDVTAELNRALTDFWFTYNFTWGIIFPGQPKAEACKWIIGLGPFGLQGAQYAWSIEELALAGTGYPTALRVGNCRNQPTITFGNACHFAGAANYAMFGLIMRMCHDSAEREEEGFEGLSPVGWQLASAQVDVMTWLFMGDHFPPWHEVVRDKLTFTAFGYKWTDGPPSFGLFAPQRCGTPSTQQTQLSFHWWWYPAKPWM
jgi:hypothetical protein